MKFGKSLLFGIRLDHQLIPKYYLVTECWGFPGGAGGNEPACQRRRHKKCGFSPWVGKTPWRRARQPTPIFLSRKSKDRAAWQLQSMRLQSQTQLKWPSTQQVAQNGDIIFFKKGLPPDIHSPKRTLMKVFGSSLTIK